MIELNDEKNNKPTYTRMLLKGIEYRNQHEEHSLTINEQCRILCECLNVLLLYQISQKKKSFQLTNNS